ncbi:MAG: hypothetical protein Q4C70_10175 [Planctomycetia bacterium]|nr:hypothetical protein [Planctomycetia bacterium]
MMKTGQKPEVLAEIARWGQDYKTHFETVDSEERYKWGAIQWFQTHWDIKAEDFPGMLENALAKVSNLVSGGKYFPKAMLLEYVHWRPEEAREMFRTFYDETLPLWDRVEVLQEKVKEYTKIREEQEGKKISDYQDLRAAILYLTLRYPGKYVFYKTRMYQNFRDKVHFVETETDENKQYANYRNYRVLLHLIHEEAVKDEELSAMHHARLDEDCYQDEDNWILAFDIMYYGATSTQKLPEDLSGYWPTLEEYNPRITTEMWAEALRNPEVITPTRMLMLQKMLELGGESSCYRLSQVYGNIPNHYNGTGKWIGIKVKKYFSCPDCIVNGENCYFVIPFLGRNIKKEGYSWRLRPELKKALMEYNKEFGPYIIEKTEIGKNTKTDVPLNTILYGPPGTGKTYHTVYYAVAIVEGKLLREVMEEEYDSVLERFQQYKREGKIEFTTFHQSYGYEDFIEGIRPKTENGR